MRLYFGISKGKLEVSDLDKHNPEPKANEAKYERYGSFAPTEKEQLTALFRRLTKEGWDGHATCSSSCDFPMEYGWPDEDVQGFIRTAILAMPKTPAEPPTKPLAVANVEPEDLTFYDWMKKRLDEGFSRAEGGVYQFGDDWPGVWLRGDEAGPMSFYLSQWLEKGSLDPMSKHMMRGFIKSLAGSHAHTGDKPVILKPFVECLVDPPPREVKEDAPETPDEHQILVDACVRLIEAIDSDFCGYVPAGINALADLLEQKGWGNRMHPDTIKRSDCIDAVMSVSR